jgi:hypothetical protein
MSEAVPELAQTASAPGRCGRLAYEIRERDLQASIAPSRPRALLDYLMLFVIAGATVLAFVFRPTDDFCFIIVPLVLTGWFMLVTNAINADPSAVVGADPYVRLKRELRVHVRGDAAPPKPRFEIDGEAFRNKDFLGIAVASVPDTSVDSRVCLIFREKVCEIANAPRDEANAFAAELARFCGVTANETKVPSLFSDGPVSDLLAIFGTLLVTLGSPFVYLGAQSLLLPATLVVTAPMTYGGRRVQKRREEYRALAQGMIRAESARRRSNDALVAEAGPSAAVAEPP